MSNTVDILYAVYDEGGTFLDSSDIAVFLESKGFGWMLPKNASQFDTLARQRMFNDGKSVETPTRETNWKRGGQLATQMEKEKSQRRRLRYAKTHSRNTATIAAVLASDPDASSEQVLAAHYCKLASEALQRLSVA